MINKMERDLILGEKDERKNTNIHTCLCSKMKNKLKVQGHGSRGLGSSYCLIKDFCKDHSLA